MSDILLSIYCKLQDRVTLWPQITSTLCLNLSLPLPKISIIALFLAMCVCVWYADAMRSQPKSPKGHFLQEDAG